MRSSTHITSFIILLFSQVHATVILESKCAAEFVLQKAASRLAHMHPKSMRQFEKSVAEFFTSLLEGTTESPALGDFTEKLQVAVAVTDGSSTRGEEDASSSTTVTLTTEITLMYTSTNGVPVHVDDFLAQLVNAAENIFEPQNSELVGMTFSPLKTDDTRIVFITEETSEKSRADVGLITGTVILSAILLVVSSVLLYVTGGWDAMHQCITNCLFEEVEEDDDNNYLARSKNTFQVQSTDQEEDEEDEESSMGTNHTNPSGVLGGNGRTQGLGIVGGYGTDGDDASLSLSSVNQLGISSATKMQEPRKQGLTGMIMQRMNSNAK